MAQYIDGPTRAFTAGGAIAIHLRVTLSGGNLAAAGAADSELGTMNEAALASGDVKTVRLNTASGTVKMVADEAIAAGNDVYGAASGKITDQPNGNFIGTALEAASGDGSVIEVLRKMRPTRAMLGVNTETLAADKTLVASDEPIQALDPGGAGRTITLPAEADSNGLFFYIVNTADAAEVLTVEDDAAATVCTPTQNESAIVFSDGTSWYGIVGDSA